MSLTAVTAILLAILFGLCGGYLDILFTLLGKYCWNKDGYFRNARDFPWTVPVGPRRPVTDPRARGDRAESSPSERTNLAARGACGSLRRFRSGGLCSERR